MEVRRYGRYWAVYDGTVLVVVTVYKRGAQEVVRRLAEASAAVARLSEMAAERSTHYGVGVFPFFRSRGETKREPELKAQRS